MTRLLPQLLTELNQKRKLVSTWPFVAVACIATLAVALATSSALAWCAALLLLSLVVLAAAYDRKRKTTVLFYDLQPPVLSSVEAMHTAFDEPYACARAWHLEAQAYCHDRKYNAGADTTVRRHAISLGQNSPPYMKTNVPAARIPIGRQTLYFFPERVLVYDSNGIGTVPYEPLQLSAEATRFIESGGVPSDTRVVDRTWQYVNKSGGPDRRFRDNPEIPIVMYEDLSLRSASGLNERIQLSRCGASAALIAAVGELARVLRNSSEAILSPTSTASAPDRDFGPPPTIPSAQIPLSNTAFNKPVSAQRAERAPICSRVGWNTTLTSRFHILSSSGGVVQSCTPLYRRFSICGGEAADGRCDLGRLGSVRHFVKFPG